MKAYILLSALPLFIYILVPFKNVPHSGIDWMELSASQMRERIDFLDKKRDKFFALIMVWLFLWIMVVPIIWLCFFR